MEDRMSMRVFGEADGDVAALRDRTVAILGYGNQGRAQALNLRDSGVNGIVVGTAEDETWTQAGADGFPVSSVAQAARAGPESVNWAGWWSVRRGGGGGRRQGRELRPP